MAKMNHDRPYFKYLNNLRRVLANADQQSKPKLEIKEPTPSVATKEKKQVQFYGNEWVLCDNVIKAMDSYLAHSEYYLKVFMTKSKGNSVKKQKAEDAEAQLRKCLRDFLFEYIEVKIKKEKNSGLPKFWKLLVKGLKGDGFIQDIMVSEIQSISEAIPEHA